MPSRDTWSLNSVFTGLSSDYGQIAHPLRTRAPVAAIGIATNALPLDLHVLGLSLAFILSQDQTLRCKINYNIRPIDSIINKFIGVIIDRDFINNYHLSAVASHLLYYIY